MGLLNYLVLGRGLRANNPETFYGYNLYVADITRHEREECHVISPKQAEVARKKARLYFRAGRNESNEMFYSRGVVLCFEGSDARITGLRFTTFCRSDEEARQRFSSLLERLNLPIHID